MKNQTKLTATTVKLSSKIKSVNLSNKESKQKVMALLSNASTT